MRFLVVAFVIGLPVLDIASLIEVGDRIGLWPTLGAVVLAFMVGSILMRAQGFAILAQAQATLQDGRLPAREVFDGVCAIIGSMLLMFPGFVSDVIGMALLLPPVRALLRRVIGMNIRNSGRFAVWTVGPDTPGGSTLHPPGTTPPETHGPETRRPETRGPIIDGECEPVAEEGTGVPARREPGAADAGGSPWGRPSTPVVPRGDP